MIMNFTLSCRSVGCYSSVVSWPAPCAWAAGDPHYYNDFEEESGLDLRNGAHLITGGKVVALL